MTFFGNSRGSRGIPTGMGVNFTFNPVIGQERELKLAGAEKQREQSQENQWELTGKCLKHLS